VLSEMGCACVAGVMAGFGRGRYAEEEILFCSRELVTRAVSEEGRRRWALGVGFRFRMCEKGWGEVG
jgi:hypothetical protein